MVCEHRDNSERMGLSARYLDSIDFVYTFVMKSTYVIVEIADRAIAIKTLNCFNL